MQGLKERDASRLRAVFLSKLGFLSKGAQGAVMQSFDRSLLEVTAGASPVVGVERKCSVCRKPSVRGEYRDGKRIWVCRECAKERCNG